MKTKTRSTVVNLIEARGSLRPVELVKELRISPQALHRHLRFLLAAGILESRGLGPKTFYVIAGKPDFRGARAWYGSTKPSGNPSELICETRDVFTARLSRLGMLTRDGLNDAELPLVISIIGEIGNNCFDHNLGHWRDAPGCWFETQVTGKRLWICIADRGQGVFHSLKRVDPSLADEQTALVAAFEKRISGRQPEHRGNGLKFVKNIIDQGNGRGLACRSGDALVDYGALGPECRTELSAFSRDSSGTVTLIAWAIPGRSAR